MGIRVETLIFLQFYLEGVIGHPPQQKQRFFGKCNCMGNFLSLILSMGMVVPHPGIMSRGKTTNHDGIDIICSIGDKIVAAHDGKVTTYKDFRMGNVVVVKGEGVSTLYAHLSSVENISGAKSGDVIGYCGSTGIWSSAPHLHFEVH